MPIPKADEIVTQQHKRYFYMAGGAAPDGNLRYAGTDGQYMNIESGTVPRGDINSINVGDPDKFKAYKTVGFESDSPDLPTFSVQFLQQHGGIPRQLYDLADCDATFYEPTGTCKDPSILSRKLVSDYIKIYGAGQNTSTEAGGGAFDGDAMVEDGLDFTALGGIYPVGALAVGEEAASEIYSEVVDVVYGSKAECAGCGPSDNGTKKIYWVINNTVASPGVGPAVGYSVDGLDNQTVVAIDGATSNDIPVAIGVVGQYLVVAYRNATTGGYFYSQLNSVTGKPGTWTSVTTGFVSGAQPLDMYVAGGREVYFCGNGGYIYKSTNILNGVSVSDAGDTVSDNLNRIDGVGSLIVAVGDGAAVVFSPNRGDTWSQAVNAPAAFSLDALEVIDEYLWKVGTDGGEVFYTNTQGENPWTEITLPALTAGSPAAIQDIIFPTPEVGYIVATTEATAGLFYGTVTGGLEWEEGSLNTFPTVDRINRLAYPEVGNRAVAANNLALAGLAGNGSDGVLLLGAASIKG